MDESRITALKNSRAKESEERQKVITVRRSFRDDRCGKTRDGYRQFSLTSGNSHLQFSTYYEWENCFCNRTVPQDLFPVSIFHPHRLCLPYKTRCNSGM